MLDGGAVLPLTTLVDLEDVSANADASTSASAEVGRVGGVHAGSRKVSFGEGLKRKSGKKGSSYYLLGINGKNTMKKSHSIPTLPPPLSPPGSHASSVDTFLPPITASSSPASKGQSHATMLLSGAKLLPSDGQQRCSLSKK
jgi:hypothetical protein